MKTTMWADLWRAVAMNADGAGSAAAPAPAPEPMAQDVLYPAAPSGGNPTPDAGEGAGAGAPAVPPPSAGQEPPKPAEEPAAEAWKEYEPDPAKSDEENAAAKAEHDATKPDPNAFDPAKLKLPDDVPLDAGALEIATPVIKELKLSQEQGQKLVEAYTAIRRKEIEAIDAVMADWREQCQKDKEFGGAKFSQNQTRANELISRFGDEQLHEYLRNSGAGNNPAVFRFVARMAAAISEDSPVVRQAAAGEQPEDPLSTLYPATKG